MKIKFLKAKHWLIIALMGVLGSRLVARMKTTTVLI